MKLTLVKNTRDAKEHRLATAETNIDNPAESNKVEKDNVEERYKKRMLDCDRLILKHNGNHLALEHFDQAFYGDIDAAIKLSETLDDDSLGKVVVNFWRYGASTPAFAALLKSAWRFNHKGIIKAAESRESLESMFRYANFRLPSSLPRFVQVWRGTSGLSAKDAGEGLSWTTDREVAFSYARKFALSYGRPLVLTTVVAKASILFFENEFNESEVVLSNAPLAVKDGTRRDWMQQTVLKSGSAGCAW